MRIFVWSKHYSKELQLRRDKYEPYLKNITYDVIISKYK